MYVSKETVLRKLPAFRNDQRLITDDQDTRDIIALMLDSHVQFAPLYDKIGGLFVGSTVKETCDNLYDFCTRNLHYKEESGDLQTVSVPQGLVSNGRCDCKGFASFICGCADAINRSGVQRIDWHYCFASYNTGFSKKARIPYHVFAVVDIKDKPIWIDPTPGARGMVPVWWINKTVKTDGMALKQVIGKFGGNSVGALPLANAYSGRFPSTAQAQQQLAANVLLNNTGPIVSPTYPQVTETITRRPTVLTITPPVNQAPVPSTQGPASQNPEASKTGTSTLLLIGGIGLGALYLLSNSKKGKTVSGIGKKGKSGSSLPLLVLLGIGGYYLYTKSQTAVDNTIATPPVVNPPADTNQNPGNSQTNLPPITSPPEVVAPARAATAQNDVLALQRDWPAIVPYLSQFTDAEVINLYNYFYTYVLQGWALHQYAPSTGGWPDGSWNTTLFNAIAAIRGKYGLII